MNDNNKNFNNKMMIEMCEQLKIKHHNSIPYHFQINGAIKATNKNLKNVFLVKQIPFGFDTRK